MRSGSRSVAPRNLIRPSVRRLNPYIPGEQPKIPDLIKLNTNENPYPPSPAVLATVKAAVDGRLRLYPNPTAQKLREKLAQFHHCQPENIIVGNGSDELLAMAVRAFVEPLAKLPTRSAASRPLVQFFHPSYSLYPVLAAIHGAKANAVPLKPDFGLPTRAELVCEKKWSFEAALTFVTTPNAPSGRGYSTAVLTELSKAQSGVVVLDEAYADFAMQNALSLALKYPHILVARTFSKAYCLCFQRVGYFVGPAELIAALDKIRDSYNVNGLGQIAAIAALEDLPYYQDNFKKIIDTRQELARKLTELDFEVFPSQANFILVRPPRFPARDWLEKLRARRILVRWFDDPAVHDFLRISIGTPEQTELLLMTVRAILAGSARLLTQETRISKPQKDSKYQSPTP